MIFNNWWQKVCSDFSRTDFFDFSQMLNIGKIGHIFADHDKKMEFSAKINPNIFFVGTQPRTLAQNQHDRFIVIGHPLIFDDHPKKKDHWALLAKFHFTVESVLEKVCTQTKKKN